MKEVYIDIDGIKARIHQWGNEGNPIIICFHGLGSTSLSFIELGDLLKNDYHIIAIDLPGHGKTPAFKNEEDYEMPNMVRWIDKVISTLTKDSFYLLAHSYGADISLHYVYTYPSKVIKTMLLDGGYYIKKDLYTYRTSKSENIDSLQSEIDYYFKDFDEYCFDTLVEHMDIEGAGHLIHWDKPNEVAKEILYWFQ